jgi:DNA-binding Lrp family transcriptional regulator
VSHTPWPNPGHPSQLARVGLAVQALIAFQVRPLSRQVIQGFQATFALSVPQVRAVYVLTGNDDFLIHVALPDLPALHALLMDHVSKRKEVIGFRTSVIYDYASQPLLTAASTGAGLSSCGQHVSRAGRSA